MAGDGIRGTTSFDDFGMDSLSKEGLAMDIESRFGVPIGKTPFDDFPTIGALVDHLTRT